jgi:hypothetical protein
MFKFAVLATVVAAAAMAGSAHASIALAYGPFQSTSLRVDAAGNAEVAWTTSAGVSNHIVVPATGSKYYHGRLTAPDVSIVTPAWNLPYKAVEKRVGTRYYALQVWATASTGPLELRFSRWTGPATLVTLTRVQSGNFLVLRGTATFQGKPVHGGYIGSSGRRIPYAAQLDCFGCPLAQGKGWTRFNAVLTKANGAFGSGLKDIWQGQRYRASIIGPNSGTTLAPDASKILF